MTKHQKHNDDEVKKQQAVMCIAATRYVKNNVRNLK